MNRTVGVSRGTSKQSAQSQRYIRTYRAAAAAEEEENRDEDRKNGGKSRVFYSIVILYSLFHPISTKKSRYKKHGPNNKYAMLFRFSFWLFFVCAMYIIVLLYFVVNASLIFPRLANTQANLKTTERYTLFEFKRCIAWCGAYT